MKRRWDVTPVGQRGASVSPPLSWKWCWLHSARIDLTTWYLKATKGLHTAPAKRKTLLSPYPFRLFASSGWCSKGGGEEKKKNRASFLDARFSTIQVFKTHPYLCLSSAGQGIFMPLWILKGHDIVKKYHFQNCYDERSPNAYAWMPFFAL